MMVGHNVSVGLIGRIFWIHEGDYCFRRLDVLLGAWGGRCLLKNAQKYLRQINTFKASGEPGKQYRRRKPNSFQNLY